MTTPPNPARRPKGTPTGGQFATSARDEADVMLSPAEAYARHRAAENERRYRSDLRAVVDTYRSDATYLDGDYIGSANLSYLAYRVAEESGDKNLQVRVEEASEVLDENPGDRRARDTCAEVVRGHATRLPDGQVDHER